MMAAGEDIEADADPPRAVSSPEYFNILPTQGGDEGFLHGSLALFELAQPLFVAHRLALALFEFVDASQGSPLASEIRLELFEYAKVNSVASAKKRK